MKRKGYQESFYRNLELKEKMEAQQDSPDNQYDIERGDDIGDGSIIDNGQGRNQLNVAVRNTLLTTDRRIEMGILAMRQRRRFKQVKTLRIKISDKYKRIYSVRTLPKFIQEELLKYPKTIENDSSYESDQEVLQKYSNDPLKYILGNDARKREALEHQEEPKRIHAARTAKGHQNYKEIADLII